MKTGGIAVVLLALFVLIAGCVQAPNQEGTPDQPLITGNIPNNEGTTHPGDAMEGDAMEQGGTQNPGTNGTQGPPPLDTDSEESPPETPPMPPEATPPSPEGRVIEMEVGQFYFDPGSTSQGYEPIRVSQGETITLQITSIDVAHGINIPQLGVNVRFAPGETVEATFTADQKGTFSFFCNVFCGAGHSSMRGEIIVE